MKIVALVHDLIDGEMKKIFQNAKQASSSKQKPLPISTEDKKPPRRNITPEGRDLDAEEEIRRKIRSGNVPLHREQPDAPQQANENELVSRMMQSFSNEQNTGKRMIAMMNTFINALQSRDDSQKELSSQLSSMERRIAGIESREKFRR